MKSESEGAQSCLTPSHPMDCILPGSSVHGIFQARILQWSVIAFSDVNTRWWQATEFGLWVRMKKPLAHAPKLKHWLFITTRNFAPGLMLKHLKHVTVLKNMDGNIWLCYSGVGEEVLESSTSHDTLCVDKFLDYFLTLTSLMKNLNRSYVTALDTGWYKILAMTDHSGNRSIWTVSHPWSKEIEEINRMGKTRDLLKKLDIASEHVMQRCCSVLNQGQKWYGPNRSIRY